MSSDAYQGHGRRILRAHVLGNSMQIIRRHTGQLCGSSLSAKQPLVARPDTITCSPSGDALADLNHFPRQITTNHKRHRQLHRHQTAADVGINRIHRSGLDAHQHFTGTRFGVGQFAHLDLLRPAGLGNVSRLH